jgi:protocatechuate 3,4-dioxygenase beta subunit
MRLIQPYAPEDAGSPPSLFPDYRSTVARSPRQPLIKAPQTLTEVTGPTGVWDRLMGPAAADLTAQHKGTPQGQRIIVSGRVLDEAGRAVPNTVVEIWQANAAGRYTIYQAYVRDTANGFVSSGFRTKVATTNSR